MRHNHEPGETVDRLAYEVIGAALEVHRVLGAGLLELVYERALCREFRLRGIPFVAQPIVPIQYKGEEVGECRLDLLVGDTIILELKAVEHLLAVHTAQLVTYLKITGYPLGLLINFNVPLLRDGIKRIIVSSQTVDY